MEPLVRTDPPRAGERGFTLIEVVMSGLVLVLASLGIYAGIDGASKDSGRNRNRSLAAVIAQQDQERMRGLDATALTSYVRHPQTRTVAAGGLSFSVTSKASYANDSDADSTCASASGNATYLRITSSVADPQGGNGPVVIDSLVSPRSDQAGAAVSVVKADGVTGVPGIPVSLDEDPSNSDTTDAGGCAQFGFLKGSKYHVSFSRPGYVDRDGNAAITAYPLTVVPGSSSTTQILYDQAGAIRATFTSNSVGVPAAARGITVLNTGMSGNAERSFATGTGPTDSGSAVANGGTFTTPTSLFPFTSAYAAWAGTCDGAKPPTATDLRSATVTPGGTATVSAPLLEPKLTITVQEKTRSGGRFPTTTTSPLAGADVWVTDVCGYRYPQLTATNSSGVTTAGFPYGRVTVCADDNGATGSYSYEGSGSATITSSTGTSVTVTIDSTSTSARGTCP